ncbi:unnamed protein product [Closterium sp. Yama58-4]|nr:unnamed protein product [Closterium sp. Yama58-4]
MSLTLPTLPFISYPSSHSEWTKYWRGWTCPPLSAPPSSRFTLRNLMTVATRECRHVSYSSHSPLHLLSLLTQRVDQVLAWLDLPSPLRPSFLSLYFEEPDESGHLGGPDTPLVAAAVKRVDDVLGRLLTGLDQRSMTNDVNLLLVSDHGMLTTCKSRAISLEQFEPFIPGLSPAWIDFSYPLLGIFLPQTDAQRQPEAQMDAAAIVGAMRRAIEGGGIVNGEALKVYLREEFPAEFEFSGSDRIPVSSARPFSFRSLPVALPTPFLPADPGACRQGLYGGTPPLERMGRRYAWLRPPPPLHVAPLHRSGAVLRLPVHGKPILALADEGYTVVYHHSDAWEGGTHGYDHRLASMRSIFMARGPCFASHRRIPTFRNTELYNVITSILKIEPAPNNGSASFPDTILV